MIKVKANYVDGIKQGREIHYYESGELKSKVNYLDWKPQGEVIHYYESGKVRFNAYFVDNKLEGTEVAFYESGGVEFIKNIYDYDEVEFIKATDYDIMDVCSYIWDDCRSNGERLDKLYKGLKYSKITAYYESGEVEFKINYKIYDRDVYQDYREVEETGYYKSGEVEYKYNYDIKDWNVKEQRVDYYKSGEIKSKVDYGYGEGEVIHYYESGEIKSKKVGNIFSEAKERLEYLEYGFY